MPDKYKVTITIEDTEPGNINLGFDFDPAYEQNSPDTTATILTAKIIELIGGLKKETQKATDH